MVSFLFPERPVMYVVTIHPKSNAKPSFHYDLKIFFTKTKFHGLYQKIFSSDISRPSWSEQGHFLPKGRWANGHSVCYDSEMKKSFSLMTSTSGRQLHDERKTTHEACTGIPLVLIIWGLHMGNLLWHSSGKHFTNALWAHNWKKYFALSPF